MDSRRQWCWKLRDNKETTKYSKKELFAVFGTLDKPCFRPQLLVTKCRREPLKESRSRNDIISYPGPEHLGSAARVCFLAARIDSIGRPTHLTTGAHNHRKCALAQLYP